MSWKIRRYSRWHYFNFLPLVRMTVILVLLASMLFLGFEVGSRVDWNFFTPSYAAETENMPTWRLVGFHEIDWKGILSKVLPVASYVPDYVEDETTGLIITAMKNITSADLTNPETFFQTQIAYFNAVPVNAEPEFIPEKESILEPPIMEQEVEPIITRSGNKPLVGIYCTHNAECYVPSQGVEKLEGKNGGVFLVAERLKNTLETQYGIPTVLADTIHDYPDWSKSYTNSLVTLQKMKKDYPSIDIFIDVHRDATTPRDTTTTEIDGKKVSKIMFIVGSDTRLPHPAWKENRDFAQRIAHQMEKMYPGLLKGVRVQDGRYNQHISPHAILLEMGGTENSLEETLRSAEMFAEVLNSIVGK
ncbi:MAG: stage II sporulation protein P [Bacillota bacterium]|jgi:stage II sporulation protein P